MPGLVEHALFIGVARICHDDCGRVLSETPIPIMLGVSAASMHRHFAQRCWEWRLLRPGDGGAAGFAPAPSSEGRVAAGLFLPGGKRGKRYPWGGCARKDPPPRAA